MFLKQVNGYFWGKDSFPVKHSVPFIAMLAVLSCISGYLMSKASLVGKIGMSLFYQEYNFLKVWWQGALVIFGALMVLFIIHSVVNRMRRRSTAIIIHIIMLCAAVLGLYATYDNFRHDLSHRWLGERFHVGVYIFWLCWMMICLFFLTGRSRVTDTNSKAASVQ
jgi:cell division protein FtsW (lipid II flippase)